MRRNWRLFLNTIKFLFRANVSTIGHTTRERVQQGSNLIYRIIWAIYLDSQSSSSLIFIITRKKKEREKGFRFLSMLYIPSMLGGGQWRRKMSPGRRSCSCCCCIFIQKGAKEGGEEEEEGGKEAVPVWKKWREAAARLTYISALCWAHSRERANPLHWRWKGLHYCLPSSSTSYRVSMCTYIFRKRLSTNLFAHALQISSKDGRSLPLKF